jgi:hypothetical protein
MTVRPLGSMYFSYLISGSFSFCALGWELVWAAALRKAMLKRRARGLRVNLIGRAGLLGKVENAH